MPLPYPFYFTDNYGVIDPFTNKHVYGGNCLFCGIWKYTGALALSAITLLSTGKVARIGAHLIPQQCTLKVYSKYMGKYCIRCLSPVDYRYNLTCYECINDKKEFKLHSQVEADILANLKV